MEQTKTEKGLKIIMSVTILMQPLNGSCILVWVFLIPFVVIFCDFFLFILKSRVLDFSMQETNVLTLTPFTSAIHK